MVVEPQILKKIPAWELQLRVGNKGANITKPRNEESHGLEEEIYEEAVLSIGDIIATTEEEVGPNTKLQEMHSVYVQPGNYKC